jgi:DNA invertase Pin-like site-specific DNA recombinase
VLFWALDRFTRKGMVPTTTCSASMATVSVFTATPRRTDNELVRNDLRAVMSSLAKVKAEKISERVKAGLQRAVANCKTLGRARIDLAIERKTRKMLEDDVEMLRIADKLNIGLGIVQRIARKMRA